MLMRRCVLTHIVCAMCIHGCTLHILVCVCEVCVCVCACVRACVCACLLMELDGV